MAATVKMFFMKPKGDTSMEPAVPVEELVVPPVPIGDEGAQTIGTWLFNTFEKYIFGGKTELWLKETTFLGVFFLILCRDKAVTNSLVLKWLFAYFGARSVALKMPIWLHDEWCNIHQYGRIQRALMMQDKSGKHMRALGKFMRQTKNAGYFEQGLKQQVPKCITVNCVPLSPERYEEAKKLREALFQLLSHRPSYERTDQSDSEDEQGGEGGAEHAAESEKLRDRSDIYLKTILGKLNHWKPGSKDVVAIIPPGDDPATFMRDLTKDFVQLHLGRGWDFYEEGKWNRQFPAQRRWGRLMLLPAGLETFEAVRFSCEAKSGAGAARDVERRKMEGIKMSSGRKWLNQPELRFTFCLRLAIAKFCSGFIDVLFATSPTSWRESATISGEEPDKRKGPERKRKGIALAVDEAESLLSGLWQQWRGQVHESETVWHCASCFWSDEIPGVMWQYISPTMLLSMGQVIMRYSIKHGFAPYDLTGPRGQHRPWHQVNDYLKRPACCSRHCQGLYNYVHDTYGTMPASTAATRCNRAMDSWEAQCPVTTIVNENDHSGHRREGTMPDRSATTFASKATTHVRSKSHKVWTAKGGRDLFQAPRSLKRKFKEIGKREKLRRKSPAGPRTGITKFWSKKISAEDNSMYSVCMRSKNSGRPAGPFVRRLVLQRLASSKKMRVVRTIYFVICCPSLSFSFLAFLRPWLGLRAVFQNVGPPWASFAEVDGRNANAAKVVTKGAA